MSSPLNISIMPSESAFKKQADIAGDALKTFTAVRDSKSLIIIRAAISELIDATVAFNNYVPFFVSHPLFQEIPPAVFTVLEDFSKKNPKFDMPSTFINVAGLDARAKDSIAAANKKGMSQFYAIFLSFIFLFSESATSLSVVRADKVGVIKKSRTSSVSLYFYFILFYLYAPLTLLQVKRPRLSKEFIDKSDDDGDELAQFVKPAATLRPKYNTVADAINKVYIYIYIFISLFIILFLL